MSVNDLELGHWLVIGLAALVGGMFGRAANFWKW